MLDGEIVIHGPDGRQLFNALGQRIHPAASRIQMLSEETPARSSRSTCSRTATTCCSSCPTTSGALRWRRSCGRRPTFELTPVVHDPADAEGWLRDAEGVIAKERDAPYKPGERTGW